MNSEPNNDAALPQDPIEVRIVAWIMGEVTSEEAADLAALVVADPQLQAFKQAMEQTAGRVGEALSQAEKTDSAAAPPTLDPARKETIQAQWAQDDGAGTAEDEDTAPSLFFAALVLFQQYRLQAACLVILVGLLWSLSIPAYQKVRAVFDDRTRLNHQRMEEYALLETEKLEQSAFKGELRQASDQVDNRYREAKEQARQEPAAPPSPVVASNQSIMRDDLALTDKDWPSEAHKINELGRLALSRPLAQKSKKGERSQTAELEGAFTSHAYGARHNAKPDAVLSEANTVIPSQTGKQQAYGDFSAGADTDAFDVIIKPEAQTQPTFTPQPERDARAYPESTFSLNVSDVSFQLAVAAWKHGTVPPARDIRSEEFLNAFDYRDPAPRRGEAFAFAWERATSPFDHNRDVLRFSLQTAASGRAASQPLNITLLIDNSGSMERADRKAIVAESLRTLSYHIQAQDTINIITFARTPTLRVAGLPGNRLQEHLERMSRLTPEGGTNLEVALALAYEVAQRHYHPNANNRVILMTDGAANLGNFDPVALKANVERQRELGIALDAYGVGWDEYNDTLLESITRNSDGNYAFLNSLNNAKHDFAEELAGALNVAAAEVKVQVVFNPARVNVYRQHGYLRHQLTAEQFRDNTVDAAELTQAESGNALYSVQLKPDGVGPIGKVHVRYRSPQDNRYYEQAWEIPYHPHAPRLRDASPALRLATVATVFAERLARNPHAQGVEMKTLEALAQDLPDHFNNQPQVKQLQQMIRAAR